MEQQRQKLFDDATVVFLKAITSHLPFEQALEHATVQEAIAQGYNIEIIKWAWM